MPDANLLDIGFLEPTFRHKAVAVFLEQIKEAMALIIIIIDFYGAYILRNLSSEAQQDRISKRNRKQGRAKVSIRTRDNRTFMVGMQFGIDVLSFFRKIAIV